MKYIVCALALIVMAGSSCKSKSEDTKPVPEIAKEPAPQNHPTEPSDDHHESEKCDHKRKCHHKHKRLPPGHEKKLHGDQSARKYAPGHNR